ncbi:MAG TPA: N-acetylmuramoyl-L-alanine amidase [Rhizomicrobium sp.]|jgi:N-acetylmuramoyl-L-alanine amidase
MRNWVVGAAVLFFLSSEAGFAEQASTPVSQDQSPGSQTSAPSAPVVMNVRVGEHPDKTRFVVELSDPAKARVFTLSAPDRVVIDLPQVLWRVSGADHPSGKGSVKSYRYGLFRPGNSRFVIDLNQPVSPAEPMLLPPANGHGYRLVVDLMATSQGKFDSTAGWPPDLRARETAAERVAGDVLVPKTSVTREKHLIVVDAGHGGLDSGTTGVNGAMEKDLVLDEALRLRNILLKHGYGVYLTRDSDVYIPLGERVQIARTHHADLFISLHADSNPDTSVSGASVYTLSEAGSDREAAALARKENQSDVIAGVDLTGANGPVASILIGLAQRDTMNRSARFAQDLVSRLGHATDVLPRAPHRSAGFVVLKAPDVPAVLIELGYLSNEHDCTQMSQPAWRQGVAAAISEAVERQFHAALEGSLATEAAE